MIPRTASGKVLRRKLKVADMSASGDPMSVVALGTYLPPWGTPEIRTVGLDEDALTIAVDAGRAALAGGDVDVHRVVLVTRDLPLLEGGNGAALVAGLGLPAGTEVVEQVGGAPAALDALLAAESGTLVIGADAGTGVGAGAAAAVVRDGDGATLAPVARAQRSLPMRTRDRQGRVHEYDDARLLRERGTRVALDESGITGKAVAAVGLGARDAGCALRRRRTACPTTGASAPLFALADLTERRTVGLVLAFEQATMTAAELDIGSTRCSGSSPTRRSRCRRARHPDPTSGSRWPPTTGPSTPRCASRPVGARTAPRSPCRLVTGAWSAAPRATPSSSPFPRR